MEKLIMIHVVSLVLLFRALSAVAIEVGPDILKNKLEKKLDEVSYSSDLDGSTDIAFLCRITGIPCCLEFLLKDISSFRPKTFRMKNASVKMILTQMMRAHPDYRWEIDNGIINVFPKFKTGQDPMKRLVKPMKLTNVTFGQAAQQILDNAGLKRPMPAGAESLFGSISTFPPPPPRKMSIDFDANRTVRDAINELIRVEGLGGVFSIVIDHNVYSWLYPNG